MGYPIVRIIGIVCRDFAKLLAVGKFMGYVQSAGGWTVHGV